MQFGFLSQEYGGVVSGITVHLRNRSSIEELKRHIPKILYTLGEGLIFYVSQSSYSKEIRLFLSFVVELQAVNIDAQGGNCSIWKYTICDC